MAEVFNANSHDENRRLIWEMVVVPHDWDKANCPMPCPDAWALLGPKQRERFLCGKYVSINIPSDNGGVWPMILVDSWTEGCFLYFQFLRQRDPGLMGVVVRAVQPQTLVASTALRVKVVGTLDFYNLLDQDVVREAFASSAIEPGWFIRRFWNAGLCSQSNNLFCFAADIIRYSSCIPSTPSRRRNWCISW